MGLAKDVTRSDPGGRGPLVDRSHYPGWGRDGADVSSLADEVRDDPMIFPLTRRVTIIKKPAPASHGLSASAMSLRYAAQHTPEARRPPEMPVGHSALRT